MKIKLQKAVLTLAACAAMTGAVEAKELIYGSWMGANATTNVISLPVYFDRIKEATNGEIEWNLIPGGQLTSGPGTVEAVGGNLIDGGTTMAPYTPRELPATNFIFNTTLAGDDVVAAAGAMNEVLLLNCPQCKQEYKRNHAVGFAGYNITPYLLMCRRPIASVADLEGVKVRASGGGISTMTIAGATPVAMNPAEATAALERGVVECVHGSLAWLKNYGYMDIVTDVLDFPLGMAGPPLLMYLNRDAWNDMSPEARKAHIDNAAELVAIGTIKAQIEVDDDIRADAMSRGINFVTGGADFEAVMAERVASQREGNIAQATDAGVENAEELLQAYETALAKWQTLATEIGTDVDKFTEALNREVYSKLDPEDM
ncbi:hypothetical protein [Mariluticola halotolerans]|uniref:hypothetical protein n=1 Tax=Mariluticola halotolerans TaxID=2909283 RepID=UPI0026E1448F|nr:hypothetical protein [Mariluticola halotolerans]UJQ94653.1 hypothetical protein L1P08_01270 [Mariluticola halotolerans]